MRDVLIVARCDKCHSKVEVTDEPLPRWTINGTTFRPELCKKCEKEILAALDFLTPAATRERKPKEPTSGKPRYKKSRKGGKFAKVTTPCPACDRVFDTPSGLSQHMSAKVRSNDATHRKYIKEGS
jgi:hypothetical protein